VTDNSPGVRTLPDDSQVQAFATRGFVHQEYFLVARLELFFFAARAADSMPALSQCARREGDRSTVAQKRPQMFRFDYKKRGKLNGVTVKRRPPGNRKFALPNPSPCALMKRSGQQPAGMPR
jgi:hypothetical protein